MGRRKTDAFTFYIDFFFTLLQSVKFIPLSDAELFKKSLSLKKTCSSLQRLTER